MKKPVIAFIVTLIAGVIGLYVGAGLNMEGYLGVIAAIATMGAFIISGINRNDSK